MRLSLPVPGATIRPEQRNDNPAEDRRRWRPPVRQIELAIANALAVIAGERTHGFEILDRRDWREANILRLRGSAKRRGRQRPHVVS